MTYSSIEAWLESVADEDSDWESVTALKKKIYDRDTEKKITEWIDNKGYRKGGPAKYQEIVQDRIDAQQLKLKEQQEKLEAQELQAEAEEEKEAETEARDAGRRIYRELLQDIRQATSSEQAELVKASIEINVDREGVEMSTTEKDNLDRLIDTKINSLKETEKEAEEERRREEQSRPEE